MPYSINERIHSSNKMLEAGFIYNGRGDVTRCILCELEVSQWTYDMDPFTIHVEQSPHCIFVRTLLSLNNFQATTSLKSSLNNDFFLERQLKQCNKEETCILYEVDKIKTIRYRSFSSCPHPISFRRRMCEAGFFACNIGDRVICIYCNLICQQWNIETDDPCKVHQILSSNCTFVKSLFNNCNSSQYNNFLSKSPSHINYVDPEKRSASFSNWSKNEFPSIDKLVEAGFFYNGSQITCFYCNGTLISWQSNNHPIAEHIRLFPYCNYARQLCGKELYYKIQQALKHDVEISKFKNDHHHHRLNELDDETLLQLVAASLDLPILQRFLEKNKFERSIVENCLKEQLRYRHDHLIDSGDLFIACEIFKKHDELINIKKKSIIIPNIALKEFYENKQRSFNDEYSSIPCLCNNSNQSYTDILQSFENDLKEYRTNQQKLAVEFFEQLITTIERERSLKNWSSIKPSRYDMTIGGFIISEKDDYSKCPHCHIQYYNWKSNDNPLIIHKYLSPNCLFVLSQNPFNLNPVPIKKIEEIFTDEDIINAQSQPYTGLVQSRYGSMSVVCQRKHSFERFPGGCPTDAHQLAISGWYYTNYGRNIKCFYCERYAFPLNIHQRSHPYLNLLHRFSSCRYIRQLNEFDSQSSTRQVSSKCTWCIIKEKKLVALPCRHFCLCESCGQIKRLCPVCEKPVTVYVIIYSP
ncbi:unnamed protein product [Rotaria sordida]|uniref:RING-type domain-containing protein n=1 Tax=Rotaria sordida TaxID=392033 RepID=A0A815GXX9_9BILA|nr:unnamed protein product [Rotaria sordida]CAF1344401.1 unnamed protein product [Rotaria sordida]